MDQNEIMSASNQARLTGLIGRIAVNNYDGLDLRCVSIRWSYNQDIAGEMPFLEVYITLTDVEKKGGRVLLVRQQSVIQELLGISSEIRDELIILARRIGMDAVQGHYMGVKIRINQNGTMNMMGRRHPFRREGIPLPTTMWPLAAAIHKLLQPDRVK